LLAVAIVVLLAGDGVGLAATSDSGSAVAPQKASAIRAVVPGIERFVEQERGLSFKRRVQVDLLDNAAFVRRLQGDPTKGDRQRTESLQKAEGFLRALHLIGTDVKLGKAVDRLLSSSVAGFYDAKTKALVVRGADPTPSVRAVLAHELTHALQDQYFGLDRPALDKRSDEASQAFTGLVEGDAVRVQRKYFESLSPTDQRALLAEEGGQGPPSDVPAVLVRVLAFPYQFGPSFVDAVLAAGGQPRLDAAFTTPPETSEQLMHPAVYLRGEEVRPVGEPKADGKVFDRGVVGELGLLLLLADDLGGTDARRAAEGWGGDRYVAWHRGTQACVRAVFAMDTPTDTAELENGLGRWASRHDGVTLSRGGPLTLTSCA
jgi:hypothetical protein